MSGWTSGWARIAAQQRAIQSAPGFIHRRCGDLVTSKVIPLLFGAVGTVAIVPGLYNMYTGQGKLE